MQKGHPELASNVRCHESVSRAAARYDITPNNGPAGSVKATATLMVRPYVAQNFAPKRRNQAKLGPQLRPKLTCRHSSVTVRPIARRGRDALGVNSRWRQLAAGDSEIILCLRLP